MLWTSDPTIIGNIILGCFTISGAALVIVAAIIQANAIKKQVKAEKNEKLRVENLQYVGWLAIAVADLKRNYMQDKLKVEMFADIATRDTYFGALRGNANGLDWFQPTIFIIGADARHLYAKLPTNIVSFLYSGEYPHHAVNEHLLALKFLLLKFADPSSANSIPMKAAAIIDAYNDLLRRYKEGFGLVEEHLKNVQERIKNDIVDY